VRFFATAALAPWAAARHSRGRSVSSVEAPQAVSTSPIVALVGRPNVGKSALFNRLLGRRLAIVEETPGVTRDRLYAPVEWLGRRFTVVDTGGIETGDVDDILAQTRAQAELAIREADVVVFVVDAQTGVVSGDDDVAALLRARRDKVLLVANKVESPNSAANIYEFCSLGFDVPMPVSAVHGLQSGDLLDAIVAKLPPDDTGPDEDEGIVRLAIIGQPNVGKSSLVNALVGKQRAIVSDTPGTTRDATDTETERDGRRFVIIDTAGIRRHVNQGPALDYYSSLRAVAAIGRCDVALLLIDAQVGATAQDRRIAGLATDEGKAFAIMVNKWDLVDAAAFDRAEVEAALRADFSFAPYVAVLFGSALTKRGVHKVWDTVAACADERRKRVATSRLNHVIRDAFRTHPPALFRGNALKCYYVTQAGTAPPEFVFFVNDPRLLHFSYRRYLENTIREAFGFSGTPMKLEFRPRVQQDATTHEEMILPRAAGAVEDAT
jgi:GTP-binding protein